MLLLIAFVSLALIVSFVCSLLEAVLLSVPQSYIVSLNTKHDDKHPQKGSLLWGRYKEDIDTPLAAILSLNTIAHTIGAAGAGAQATRGFCQAYFGLITAVLTILILVFSEIIPKTLGAKYWRQFAPASIFILHAVVLSMYPLVKMAKILTKLLSKNGKDHSISREEFSAMAQLGASEGILGKEEYLILKSLMRFRALTVSDIMTPRGVIFSIPASESIETVLQKYSPLRFSRIPVFKEQPDNIIGFIRKDDLLEKAITSPQEPVTQIKRNILTVLDKLSLPLMMNSMMNSTHNMALVVNEYGDTKGLVTMEDLVETMLGIEIMDETDTAKDMQLLARQLWQERAKHADIIGDSAVEKTAHNEATRNATTPSKNVN